MARPTVSIVMPFAGGPAAATAALERLATVRLGPGDEAIFVDNSTFPAAGAGSTPPGVRRMRAARVASSYAARNAGAFAATGDWLLFIDADVEPSEDLLKRYFEPAPGETTAILAGGVRDSPVGDDVVSRLSRETAAMGQQATLSNSFMPYAITANCALRASVFHQLEGFAGDVVSAGDADFCWRAQRAGFEIEERAGAAVVHRNRSSLRALWSQRARHGAGAAWLGQRWPGAMPAWSPLALIRDSATEIARRDGEPAVRLAKVSGWWAFELGRRHSNHARVRS